MSSTPAPLRRYRWTILAAGVFAQAANSAILLGLARDRAGNPKELDLTLTEVGVVLAAVSFGSVATLLLWGIVADRIGERAVIADRPDRGRGRALLGRLRVVVSELVAALVRGRWSGRRASTPPAAARSWRGSAQTSAASPSASGQMAAPLGGAVAALALPALNSHISLHAAFDGLGGCVPRGRASSVRSSCAQSPARRDHSVLARPLRDPRVWRICIASTFYVTTQLSLLGFFVLFLHDHRGVSTSVAAAGLAATQVLGGDRARSPSAACPTSCICVSSCSAGSRSGSRSRSESLAALLDLSVWIVIPALVDRRDSSALSWNGLSFTAAAEAAGRAQSGAAIGLQQTFLSGGAIVAPIAFATVVHNASWRLAFVLAALSPLVGYALLSPLAERRP